MYFYVKNFEYLAKSQFNKIIVTDYYDGPLSGYCLGSVNLECYFFSMVAWHQLHDMRLYAIAELAPDDFAELENQLTRLTYHPNYPLWVLEWKEDPRIRDECEAVLSDAKEKIGSFSRYMISNNLPHRVGISTIPDEEIESISLIALNEDYQTLLY